MNERSLNVVFIGRPTFPIGAAMTKRHKYYIDYLITLPNISICKINTWNIGFNNPETGLYKGKVTYYNTFLPKKISSIPLINKRCNKILEERFNKNEINIAIFSSYFPIEQISILYKAKKLGYKIICDVVENYEAAGNDMSAQMKLSFYISKKFLYKKVDGFIAISKQIESAYNKYGKPILMLTNSAPIKEVSQKIRFNDPMKIVYTGTFASKDGLKYLIEGFNLFLKKKGNVAELILIGKGKGSDKLEKSIADNKQIKKLGFVSDEVLEKIQLAADLLCMTRCNSDFANYGFPFKLSEYMATGNPILATSVGDVPLYIKDKQNGLLIEPSNAKSISEALQYAYQHQEECITMGKKGLETIQKFFDVEKNGKSLYQFILNI